MVTTALSRSGAAKAALTAKPVTSPAASVSLLVTGLPTTLATPERLSPAVVVPVIATGFALAGQRTVGLTVVAQVGGVLSTLMPVKVVVVFCPTPSVQVPAAVWSLPSLAR